MAQVQILKHEKTKQFMHYNVNIFSNMLEIYTAGFALISVFFSLNGEKYAYFRAKPAVMFFQKSKKTTIPIKFIILQNWAPN